MNAVTMEVTPPPPFLASYVVYFHTFSNEQHCDTYLRKQGHNRHKLRSHRIKYVNYLQNNTHNNFAVAIFGREMAFI